MTDGDDRLLPVLEAWLDALDDGRDPDLLVLAGGDAELAARVRDIAGAHPGVVRFLRAGPAEPDAELPPSLPPRLGEFRLLRRLGAGGMGTVYLARQESLNRLVAVKVLDAARFRDPRARLRLQREAAILAALDHPGVVPVHAVGEEDGVPFLAMKCLSGPSLDQAGAPLPPERVAALGAEVARALDAVHLAGIVHRDIKPANVILDDGRPCLVDFGLARGVADATLTSAGAVPGTLAYLAPEQLAAGGRAGPAADVYALGATLYELASGRPPFAEDDPERLVRAILADDPPPLCLPKPRRGRAATDERDQASGHRLGRAPVHGDSPRDDRNSAARAHRGLEAVILRALDKDPARRFATAADLAEDLERLARGDAPDTRRAGPFSRLWRRARRHPRTSAGVAAALLAVLALGVVAAIEAAAARETRGRALASARDAVKDGEYAWAVSLLSPHAGGDRSGDEAARLYREARAGAALDALLAEVLARPESVHPPTLRAALRELEEAAGADTESRPATLAAAIAHWHLGDDEAARNRLEEARRRHGREGAGVAAVGKLLAGDRSAAAVSGGATSADAGDLVIAAAALILLEAPHDAVMDAIDAAEAAGPGHRRARFLRATALAGAGRLREALAAFQDLARGRATSRVIRLHLARTMIRLGRLDDAERELDALPGGPRTPVELSLRLAIWSRRGDNRRAAETLAAWRDDPGWRDDATLLRLAGEMEWMAGRSAEGLALLERSLARAESGVSADLTTASLFKVRDQPLGEAVPAEDPGSMATDERRANLEIVAAGRRALPRLRHPGARASVRWIVARACIRLGEPLRAWRELELALRDQPTHPEAKLETGVLAFHLNELWSSAGWATRRAAWTGSLKESPEVPREGAGMRRLALLRSAITASGRRRLREVLDGRKEGAIELAEAQFRVATVGLTLLATDPAPDSEALMEFLPEALPMLAPLAGGADYGVMSEDFMAVRRVLDADPPWSGSDLELVPALASER